MKIYTRTGDKGETSLLGGERVTKDALRVETYGDVDELNAQLGLIAAETTDSALRDILLSLQDHLFVIGAALASPRAAVHSSVRAIADADIAYLERCIDATDVQLPRLTHFILPGGSPEAARLHVARAVCRRAERSCVRLSRAEQVNPTILTYLNRLSDLLFVLARMANLRAGIPETLWPPRREGLE